MLPGVGQVVNTLQPVPDRRTVHARLMAPVGWYTVDGQPREVVTHWTATIATDGTWSLELPASSSYDVENTWYRVDEPGASHAAVMPDGAGPFQLHDIAIIDPAAPPCCPPTPAGGADGGVLAGRVLAVEIELDAHHIRLDTLEASDDQQGTRLNALEAATGVGSLDYRHTQSAPASLVQIVHNLPFRPAGVQCTDLLDQPTEFDRITHPAPGTTEITFGAPFTGVVDLS